jgi:acetyl/propionyl-CoA carboxylase alpha subunit/acetyl-CoA carboxylase carboxyltransferase component
MNTVSGFGRVAVVDAGESAPRVLRTLRELSRAGQANRSVLLHGRGDQQARLAREADEARELGGSIEEALRAAHADRAWLGPAPLVRRAEFAEACSRATIAYLGPSAEVLRRLSEPRGLTDLAAQLGVPAAATADSAARSRFIEVVAARDASGTVRVLGIGDATLQRGQLALLVESPPEGLSRAEDGMAQDLALRACTVAGWVGVCSVQLLFDPRTRRFALAGVDTLAHAAPAVEAQAGIDLVRLALSIAAGAPLGEVAPARAPLHSFAARILAQDPGAGSAPAPGPVELASMPSGPGLRADVAVREGERPEGSESVLATVVTTSASRAEALHRLQQALVDGDLFLRGSGTSKAWLVALCGRPEVVAGEVSLGFLDELAASHEKLVQPRREAALLAAGIEAYQAEEDLERARFVAEARRGRPRVGPLSGRTLDLRYLGQRYRLEVRRLGPTQYRVTPAGGAPADVELERIGRFEQRLTALGLRHRVLSTVDGLRLLIQVDDVAHLVQRDPSGVVTSPMPAVVSAIHVQRGQQVGLGDPLVRIESMKVEVQVTAPFAGIVREVLAPVNGQVDAGAPLLRVEPLTEEAEFQAQPAPEPLSLGNQSPPPATDPEGRYLGALAQLRQLLLGFDVTPTEARKLAAGWQELASAVSGREPSVLREEDWALGAFAEVQALFSRARAPQGPPPLEELWRYLHGPEARGAGLTSPFVAMLRRALSRYGVSMDAHGRALELALLRIQKAHDRAGEQLGPIAAILERRLRMASKGTSREVLDRLASLGQELFPALADLAREVRYRTYDQPILDRVRAEAYAQAEADLSRLPAAAGEEGETILERLVSCPQPLTTLLLDRLARTDAAFPRPRLVETVMHRYYRFRSLEPAAAFLASGLPCARAEYELHGQRYLLLAAAAPVAEAGQAARTLARLASDVPVGREAIAELYFWQEGPAGPPDAVSESLRRAIEEAGFSRPRRVSVVLATLGRGLGSQSQQHFTFRPGPAGFVEEHRYRDAHPMLFERLQLGRLSGFDLERLPSKEDLYLYRGVAQGNPKDERLFAMAEVRDLTPVRDADGRVEQLPELERVLNEALAGMRIFQARRQPHQRLEWNRVLLTLTPPLAISRDEVEGLSARLMPATEGLGLEMVLLTARVPDASTGRLRETLIRVTTLEQRLSVRWDEPTDRPLQPMTEYQQKVVQLRRRGLTHPFELLRILAPQSGARDGVPAGKFVEYDLDAANALCPVARPPGSNTANLVVGVIESFTERYPEGMRRVIVLGDPGREMGSVAEPECRRIEAAIDLAEKLGAPLEWFEVCAGAKISMTSGTENMDWVSRVLRRLIEFTQAGGEVNVVVLGITVGAQPYWNAEATMLMHTRGILVMAPGSTMVLTGKQALEYSGSVSAEDNEGIGGYDRIMGPNGQAQYRAGSVGEAIQILLRHYEHSYLAPGERFPRRAPTSDSRDRDVRAHPHGPEGGAGFETIGDIFKSELNPERKKPFDIRKVMAAAIDQDHAPLERWRDLRGGDTAVVWDAHFGGLPVCLVGIQSRPLPRQEFVPADGPEFWSAGTLFPQSSKKIARAINSASGNRPMVILANLSGFDGSPESMRRLQLEYGAEIGRAVVNFQGPIVFCVVSRYHGGAFVVFAKTLTANIEIAALEGARASVIGGAPAAAVVFARDVETRTRKDPRVVAAGKSAAAGNSRALDELIAAVRSEKLGEVGDEYDTVHSVERALKMGSLDRIIAPRDLRSYLIDALERGMAKFRAQEPAVTNIRNPP